MMMTMTMMMMMMVIIISLIIIISSVIVIIVNCAIVMTARVMAASCGTHTSSTCHTRDHPRPGYLCVRMWGYSFPSTRGSGYLLHMLCRGTKKYCQETCR